MTSPAPRLSAWALAACLTAPSAAGASEGAPDPRDEALLAACGEGDGLLAGVAARLAGRRLLGSPAPPADELGALLREAGGTHPWPRALVLAGRPLDRAALGPRIQAWARGLPGGPVRRCGVATQAGEGGEEALSVVSVPALADLVGLPRAVRVGAWVTVDARLDLSLEGARLVLLGPSGLPRSPPASTGEGRLFGRFAADRPGRWLLQVVADRQGSPEPVLEAQVLAGDGPAVETGAPGEDRTGPTPEASLLAMLNEARLSEGLAPLDEDPALTRLARAHARRMARRRLLAHDAGEGDPDARMARAGLEAKLLGENVAHAPSLALAHRSLWASPSHRQNLLSRSFRAVGLGVSRGEGGSVWVAELFASP